VSATFELDDLAGDLASWLPDLAVGPWRCAPAGLVAFSAGALPVPCWRIGLGRDQDASQRALVAGERSVADTHARLDDLPERLDRAIDHALDHALAGTPVARAHPADAALAAGAAASDAGAWLGQAAAWLAPGARTAARSSADRGLAGSQPGTQLPTTAGRSADARLIAAMIGDGGALETDLLAWSTAPAPARDASAEPGPGRLASALERIADLARGRSRIETRVEGALVAHSLTTLSGDTELWIAPRLSLTGARLHARSVAVAVRTRHAWARILTLVVRGAARLAALGLPAGAISALPVVWRFVRDVLRELRHRDAALRAPA